MLQPYEQFAATTGKRIARVHSAKVSDDLKVDGQYVVFEFTDGTSLQVVSTTNARSVTWINAQPLR